MTVNVGDILKIDAVEVLRLNFADEDTYNIDIKLVQRIVSFHSLRVEVLETDQEWSDEDQVLVKPLEDRPDMSYPRRRAEFYWARTGFKK